MDFRLRDDEQWQTREPAEPEFQLDPVQDPPGLPGGRQQVLLHSIGSAEASVYRPGDIPVHRLSGDGGGFLPEVSAVLGLDEVDHSDNLRCLEGIREGDDREGTI